MNNPKFQPPTTDAKDKVHTVVRIATSLFSGLGAEIFNYLITPPIEKRRDEWMQSVAEGLQALEEKHEEFKIEALAENEVFVSTLLEATRAAMLTHQKEKLLALRNSVLNASLPESPDETRQKMFLKLIDEFTEWHIRVLSFFQKDDLPVKNFKSYQSPRGFPDLDSREEYKNWVEELRDNNVVVEFISQRSHSTLGNELALSIIRDLENRGLVKLKTHRYLQVLTKTQLGIELLNFITSPVDDNLPNVEAT